MASLMALFANAHRDPKKGRPFRPADFDPFAAGKQAAPRAPNVGIGVLKTVFVDPFRRAPDAPDSPDARKEATP